MTIENFLSEFDKYNSDQNKKIYQLFYTNAVDIEIGAKFYKLLLETIQICYKYNAHLYYEPFEKDNTVNWEYFIIKNRKEILLKVYYTSSYDIQRIEDNLTALYL
jgi:hypothetical protein